MRDFLSQYLLWIKAFHVIAVIAWMAGMLYLPRLFVYHCQTPPGTEGSERFKVMERKLMRGIINPAMIAVWVLGLTLAATPGLVDWRSDGWIYVKLTAVLGLTWYHHWLLARWKDFEQDRNTLTGRRYRAMNEVPTLALVVIVIMVVVRPF